MKSISALLALVGMLQSPLYAADNDTQSLLRGLRLFTTAEQRARSDGLRSRPGTQASTRTKTRPAPAAKASALRARPRFNGYLLRPDGHSYFWVDDELLDSGNSANHRGVSARLIGRSGAATRHALIRTEDGRLHRLHPGSAVEVQVSTGVGIARVQDHE